MKNKLFLKPEINFSPPAYPLFFSLNSPWFDVRQDNPFRASVKHPQCRSIQWNTRTRKKQIRHRLLNPSSDGAARLIVTKRCVTLSSTAAPRKCSTCRSIVEQTEESVGFLFNCLTDERRVNRSLENMRECQVPLEDWQGKTELRLTVILIVYCLDDLISFVETIRPLCAKNICISVHVGQHILWYTDKPLASYLIILDNIESIVVIFISRINVNRVDLQVKAIPECFIAIMVFILKVLRIFWWLSR